MDEDARSLEGEYGLDDKYKGVEPDEETENDEQTDVIDLMRWPLDALTGKTRRRACQCAVRTRCVCW